MLYRKKDYVDSLREAVSDFGLTSGDVWVARQDNDFAFSIWVNGKDVIIPKMNGKYSVMGQGFGKKVVKVREGEREFERELTFNKFTVVKLHDENGKMPTIDARTYPNVLLKEGLIDPERFEISIGYDISKNEPLIMSMKAGNFEGFSPIFIGKSRSGKGIAMRSMIYQLAMNPMTEFFVVDKQADFQGFMQGTKKMVFGIDRALLSKTPARFAMFWAYLNALSSSRSRLYNSLGFTDYKSYYKAFYKQVKEGVAEGDEPLPAIPYTVIVFDEISEQRKNYIDKGGDEKLFDNLIGAFMNVAQASGMKLLGGTQHLQKSDIGAGFMNNPKCLFTIEYGGSIDGVANYNKDVLGSGKLMESRLFLTNNSWIKPPFTDGDEYVKVALNGESWVPERHSQTINELFLSESGTSEIIRKKEKIYRRFEIDSKLAKRLEGGDFILPYLSLMFKIDFFIKAELCGINGMSVLTERC